MKPTANFPIPTELEALDAALENALRTGDGSKLVLLGYGEISCVLQFDRDDESFACKRLPIFQNELAAAAYARVFDDYLRILEERGVMPTPSRLVTLEGPGPSRRVYCVQHKLESASLLPKWLATATDAEAARIFGDIVNLVENVAKGEVGFGAQGAAGDPKPHMFNLGIDGQASNWALVDGKLVYLDVTTPLLRDQQGAERLDMDLFLASLPWALRFVVKKLMLQRILDKYYVPRGIVLDFLGNLIKEKLEAKIPVLLDMLGDRFTPRISEKEVRAYYDDDANTWALLQRLRRIDRTWQNKIRRRVYPFLLPGPISR